MRKILSTIVPGVMLACALVAALAAQAPTLSTGGARQARGHSGRACRLEVAADATRGDELRGNELGTTRSSRT